MSADAAQSPLVWTAPLVPVALALTAGIVLDRLVVVPLVASAIIAAGCMFAWLIFASTAKKGLALAYLWLGVAGVGAAYHHGQRHYLDPSDISRFASDEPTPLRLRGVVHSVPQMQMARRHDALLSLPMRDTTRFVLRVTERQELSGSTWHAVTGLAQVTLVGRIDGVTVGDEIELLGRLALPPAPMNPGEFDYASFLRDQGITATFRVVDAAEVTLVRRGWPTSLVGTLALLRGWGQQTLTSHLSSHDTLATALLLGDGSGMSGDDWEQYLRTGVIHVLAISGQHLVVLAFFLWPVTRLLGVRRRHAALFIALFLIGYALLTGGRPPAMRAAWTVSAYCGAIVFRRRVHPANTLALAWIGVALVNPMDLFNAGCQLSFLAVIVLLWGVERLQVRTTDPLDRLIQETRPWPWGALVRLRDLTVFGFKLNTAVWLVVTPLVASHYHLVSPVALIIGPPMALLTSLAILSGFGLFVFAWCPPIAWLCAWLTQGSLWCCEMLVSLAQHIPGAYFFVADVPTWWVVIYITGILLGLTLPLAWRYGRWLLVAGVAWLGLGVLLQLGPHAPGEFRCTFVAVGHGGCTVIETRSGRVIVYDAGATMGPDVTRRHIAPFLWSRGIRRIDDLILSHADLDHFNGVIQLAERFAIGRVIATPLFARRESAGLKQTLSVLASRSIPINAVHAGQSWDVDGVSFDVVHPPEAFVTDKENARSLVLQVRSQDWTMLLTGDLEDAGLQRVLRLPARPVDLLMAPHHGSDRSNIPALAAWAKPKLVVSCQTAPLNERTSVKMYARLGIPFWGTWPHGMVTICQRDGRTWAETFRTGLRHDF